MTACTSPPPQPVTFPAYNHTYGIATHNSYWINRSDQVDYFSSGTQELLTDQLLHEHVRFIELDAHSQGAPAHDWKIYHTSDSEDTSCRYLTDCLEYLRDFQYAVPQHEVVNVMIELKNVVPTVGYYTLGVPMGNNFSADHTMADFDAIFQKTLGNTLYTPRDFLSRCTVANASGGKSGGQPTIRACARQNGWPTIDQLRGKFIVNLLGNFSTAAYDWAMYAGNNIENRVAFPMQSIFEYQPQRCPQGLEFPVEFPQYPFPREIAGRATVLDGSTTACIADIDTSEGPSPFIDPDLRQKAFDASIFWQLEDVTSINGTQAGAAFLKDNGVIRGHDSFGYFLYCAPRPVDCQEPRIRAGYQMIQTDYPWHFVDNTADWTHFQIPTDPSQRLRDPSSLPDPSGHVGQFSVYREPGSRLYFQTGPQWPGVWVYSNVPATSERWLEATVSSTRHGDTWGETTHSGLILDDYIKTCPWSPSGNPLNDAFVVGLDCTNFARTAQEDGEGCVRVMSASELDGVEICRQKNNPGGPTFYQESVDLYIRVYLNGVVIEDKQYRAARYGPCRHPDDPNSGDVASTCIGSLIAVAVRNMGQGQKSEVQVYSAGELKPQQPLPNWGLLESWSLPQPMTKQGFRGWKSELLVGLRIADKLNRVNYTAPVTPSPGVIGPPAGTRYVVPDPTRLRDISLLDLPNREAAGNDSLSRVVNLSFN